MVLCKIVNYLKISEKIDLSKIAPPPLYDWAIYPTFGAQPLNKFTILSLDARV